MGIGERRGGRRAGGRRHANHHRHNHHHHHYHHNPRRHHGGRTVTHRPTNVKTGKQAILTVFTMICPGFVIMGISMAGAGGFTSSTLGIIGMAIFLTSVVSTIIIILIWRDINKNKRPVIRERGVEAANVNSTFPSIDLEGFVTSTSQIGETFCTTQTAPVQPGGVAMGTQGHNQHPGFPGDTFNYTVSIVPLPNHNGPTISENPAEPPTNLMTAPMQTGPHPINNTPYPPTQPAAESYMGVDPASEGNSMAPPPSYDDVMAGKGKYNAAVELGSGAI